MSYMIDRTEDEILIRLPISTTPKSVQNALNFLSYVELGQSNQIKQSDIEKLVKETKGKWWADNKERFRDVEGFERFFE